MDIYSRYSFWQVTLFVIALSLAYSVMFMRARYWGKTVKKLRKKMLEEEKEFNPNKSTKWSAITYYKEMK